MFLFSWMATETSTIRPTCRMLDCSAGSSSGTATSGPPPSPWMSSCSVRSARTTIIWGFHHVAGFRRRHVGASIQDDWTSSLHDVQRTLDADTAHDRTMLLRAQSQELGPTRDAVIEAVLQRLTLSAKHAGEAYMLAESSSRIPDPSGATCKGSRD